MIFLENWIKIIFMSNPSLNIKINDNSKQKHKLKLSPFGHLFKFFGWWLGFTGLYSTFAVCPFCGQAGCPVGIATAGTVGAFLTLCVQDWKRFFSFLKQSFKRKL